RAVRPLDHASDDLDAPQVLPGGRLVEDEDRRAHGLHRCTCQQLAARGAEVVRVGARLGLEADLGERLLHGGSQLAAAHAEVAPNELDLAAAAARAEPAL